MMVAYLFPRIAMKSEALMIARQAQDLGPTELAAISCSTYPGLKYSTTGGHPVDANKLEDIRRQVITCAGDYGYPKSINSSSINAFDYELSQILYREMLITPNEAAQTGIWEFLSCLLMPDIVSFRFPRKDGTTLERFLGGPRNTFERLWWRAFIFNEDALPDSQKFLCQLREDELVQIMERRAICGNRRLVRQTCSSFLTYVGDRKVRNRMELMREVQKRILRLTSIISFDAIDDTQLKDRVNAVVEMALASLQ